MTVSLARVPCTIVTGFLGAGKTTLIRHVLANANGRRLAVIVNEFGDVGIDGEILKGCGDAACPEDNIVELANGCLCCTVADEFVPALDQILAREPAVEHIVIETSGLALPKPLVQAFHWPAIKSRVTVDGVVAVVDGAALADGRVAADLEALAAQRAADTALDHDNPIEEVFEDQIACADLVVLNKRDLLDAAGWRRRSRRSPARCRARSKSSPSRTARSIPPRCSASASAPRTTSRTARPITTPRIEHDHDDFDSFVVALPEIGDPAALAQPRRRHGGGPRRVAHEGFRGGRGQADAPAGAGGRPARQPPIRPAMGGIRGAPGQPRGDRAEGLDRARRRRTLLG